MAKKLITFIFAILFIPVLVFADGAADFRSSKSSGEQTSSGIVYTGTCHLASLLIVTNGTNDARVIIYDSTAASGTVVYDTQVAGGDGYGGRNWAFPVNMSNGIYAAVSGTGASYIVEYID